MPSTKISEAMITAFLLLLSFLQCCNSQDLICCDGAVRLSGGSLSNEGRVEICESGQWKTVCDNNWSENEARVVCRQLGHATQGVVPLIQAAFGMGTGMIVEQVRCSGTERRLEDCVIRDITDGECNHNEDAAVRCSCRNGDLRLQGSAIKGRGRVEVCVHNVWGTICDNSWNSNDARVVCNQLGFSRFGSSFYCCARDGPGSGPIHMTNVRCIGNESSLTDCPYTKSNNCHHGEDVSIQCQTRIVCYDGNVRLVNGRQPHEGRIEICFNETWGTICDWIYPLSWNRTQADVVCKQLGYPQAESSTQGFGEGSLPASITGVECRGSESGLAECSYSTNGQSISNCVLYSGTTVGVQCRSDAVEMGMLRLTNGLTQYEGRVEMYWNSEWKFICNDEWDERDAVVVCRQLGYLATSIQIHVISYDGHHFKSERSPVLLANVGCTGSESNLTSCCSTTISINFYCHSQYLAGVRCSQCIENSIQLVGELSQNEGSPVICLGGGWGKVCDVSTSATAVAVVACRQLGFSIEDPAVHRIYYSCFHIPNGFGASFEVGLPFSIANVQCTSNETQLSQCVYDVRSTSSWRCRHSVFKISCKTSGETVAGAPQNLKISNASLNSSSITLTWFPPLVSEIQGLTISGYIINCSTDPPMMNSSIKHTDALSVTFSNLRPFTSHNCCVAAVSNNGRGKLACIINARTEEDICVQHQNQGPLVLTSSILGMICSILLIVAIVAGIYMGYRLCKCDKKITSCRPAQVPVYDLVDMPPRGDSGHRKPENHPCEPGNVNIERLILKQEQAKDLPHEYSTPITTKFDQRACQDLKNQVVANEKCAYQPLIPPRLMALGDDKSEYQSLTQKTLPAKFSVPPARPPKSKATSAITQGSVQHVKMQ